MLNRRLWILFLAFFLLFLILTLRLAKLQFSEADDARIRIAQFLHPQDTLETNRGTIFDRFGPRGPITSTGTRLPRILAQDVPSDELAIDYRAVCLDDAWLTRQAIGELRARNEWGHFESRTQRNRRIDEVKAELAAKVDSIPDFVAAALCKLDNLPVEQEKEKILQRYFDIMDRVHAMRQDIWTVKYLRDAASQGPSADPKADISDTQLDAMYKQIQLKDELSAHTLRASLPPDLALQFRAAHLPGLMVRDMAQFNRRDYPFGASAAQLVGTLRNIDPDTLNRRRFKVPDLLKADDNGDLGGYLPGDRIGEAGVEKVAESLLHGSRGQRLDLTKASATQPADDTSGRHIDAQPGQDVVMTIDASLQNDLYTALVDSKQSLTATVLHSDRPLLEGDIDGKPDGKIHFAALVVLKIDTGELLSIVSYPSFDPNTYDTDKLTLMKDTYRRPLVSRALGFNYAPGSTVKPLLASAALTEHVITPGEEINCIGHFYPNNPTIYRCDAIHGPIALVDAIGKSCNIYFYTVGSRLGIDRLNQWYGDYGFGKDSGMELPESNGKLPKPDAADPSTNISNAILMGIGQGPIDVTPLQMAHAYATLLNNGEAIAPRILMSTPIQKSQAVKFSSQDFKFVRQGMEECTSTGTAASIFSKLRLKVGGKTGTAERDRDVFDDDGSPVDDATRPILKADGTPALKPDGSPAFKQLRERHDDAWFVGYAPEDHPQYVVAAVMEWGGHGGRAAAPMVREAFLQLQNHGYLPKTDLP